MGKLYSVEEAFERAIQEEIARKMIVEGWRNREIKEVTGLSRNFSQIERGRMLRSGEYRMRREKIRESWYQFIRK